MIRETVGKNLVEAASTFRYRGRDTGRLENLSDGVFALAITLLLISTSPPTTIHQLKQFGWELIPFTICIVLIMIIWHEHFVFFYRYGLRDIKVIVLNTSFLIIVLFYVYPLKFLWRMLLLYPLSKMFGQTELQAEIATMFGTINDTAILMVIYGVGVASVYYLLAAMYWHALRKSARLELSPIEHFDTRVSVQSNLLMAIVPTISVLLALILRDHREVGTIAGFTYFLYMPVMFTHGSMMGRKRAKLLKSQDTNST
jgi:uncharacterized membrane protein